MCKQIQNKMDNWPIKISIHLLLQSKSNNKQNYP